MGLFDFAANIGKKVFTQQEQASEAVTNHIAEDNPGVENVAVNVENGVASISGVAVSAEAVEKAVLMAGNIEGIETVNIDELKVLSGTVANDDEFYTIQKGDTLWAIAEKHYGNGVKYKAIVEANKEVIKDENKIFSGQKIRLPKSL